MGATGDFGRLAGTIAALNKLATVPSQVSGRAAPRITERMQTDTSAAVSPYKQPYAPHMPATIKRYGAHPLLNLSGAGIDSLKAAPMGGSGIEVTADDHMAFTQAGTPTQEVRAVMPNNAQLPASWNRILKEETEAVLLERLGEIE